MSIPNDDSSIPLIHDPESVAGSPFPGLDEAPTQVKPHAAIVAGATGASPPGDPAPHLLGARLDHFELLDSIGVGGMGRVFRARDTLLDRLVALKVLSPELSTDAEICRRFEQEAKAAARLDDRHFPRVYFFGFDKGLRYIAMEYVEGENIRQKIQKNSQLPVALVINVGIQIARGLAHAAACGVVHRDIKPSNIIVAPDGTAKLVDMGLARNFFQQSSPASELTQAGVTLGTFDYISPEQALDPRDADVRSDIYSLGCTLYHALTGRPPFSKGSALQKILQHQNDTVPDPRRFSPNLPEPMVAVLMKMLAKDPKERYQHPVELIDDFRAVARYLDIPMPEEVGQVPVKVSVEPLWSRQLVWLAPLLVLLAAIGIHAWLDQPTEPAVTPPPSQLPANVTEDQARPTSARATTSAWTDSSAEEVSPKPKSVVAVGVDQDLLQVLREAPAGAALRLEGARYVLTAPTPTPLRFDRPLQIEPAASTGTVEVVVPASWWGSRGASAPFLVTGQGVRFERIVFRVENPRDLSSPGSLFSVAGGDVSLRGCELRFDELRRAEPFAAFQVDPTSDRRLARITIVESLVRGADNVVRGLANGETTLRLADCGIFGTARVPFLLEGLGDVNLALDHISLRCAGPTVFCIHRSGGVRLSSDRSIFSTSHVADRNRPAGFVEFVTDGTWVSDADVWWTGRSNLFHGFTPLTISRGGIAIATSLEQARRLGFDEAPQAILDGQISIWEEVDPTVDADGLNNWSLQLRDAYPSSSGEAPGVRRVAWSRPVDIPRPVAATPTPPSRVETPTMTARPDPLKLVTVDPTAEADAGAGIFSSLLEACETVPTGTTIEVRSNGRMEEADIPLVEKSLTLRPAQGFSPRLSVGESRDTSGAAVLFRLDARSQLTLDGMAVSFSDNRTNPASFAVAHSGSVIQLVDVPVTWDSTGRDPRSSFIRVSPNGSDEAVAELRFIRSVVRTGGTVMTCEGDSVATVSAIDSLLASSGPLVRADNPWPDPPKRPTTIRLQRTTVLLAGSLVSWTRTSTDTGPAPPPTVDALQSVILATGVAPLFAVTNESAHSSLPLPTVWTGKGSFLAGFRVGWEETTRSGIAPRTVSMTDWSVAQGLTDDVCRLGSDRPFEITSGSILTEAPPNLASLRKAGLSRDLMEVPGVAAQLLPSESR